MVSSPLESEDNHSSPDASGAAKGFSPRLRNHLHLPQGADFKRRSVRGGAWALASQIAGTLLQLVATVLLARILSPSDYGLQAMVLSFTGFLSLFKEGGLGSAAIQRESLTHDDLSTLFWINAATGLFLSLLTAAIAPVLVAFYHDPRLYGITLLSAPIFFINSLSIQHRALLDRAMRFTVNYRIDIFSTVVGTIVAIWLAFVGWGYWALIVQNVSIPIAQLAAVLVAIPWIPGRPRWSHGLREMLHFGSSITFNNLLGYFAYNSEKFLLGHFWGSAPLGIYGRAYQLGNLPVQQFTGALNSVIFPTLARLQGDAERLRRFHLKAHSLVVFIAAPVAIGIALFAGDIVTVVLGPRWTAVTPVLRLLAPAMLIFALISPVHWLLRATGRVRRHLYINFVVCPVMILAVFAGVRFGPTGVAFCYSATMMLLIVPVFVWALRGTGVSLRSYVPVIGFPLAAGLVGGAAGWLAQRAVRPLLPTLLVLAVELTVALAVYLFLLLIVFRQKDLCLDVYRQLRPRSNA